MKKIVILLILINAAYFLWQAKSEQSSAEVFVGTSAVPSLVLLDEASQVSTPELTDTVQQATSSDPSAVVTDVAVTPDKVSTDECVVLNGIIDQAAGEKAISFLSQQNIKAQLKVVDVQTDGDYLVYLPPFDSHEAAVKKLRELKAQSIDSFIIADGERANGISLGVFSKEESAKKMQTLLKSKGYNASLGKNTRSRQEYALQMKDQTNDLLPDSLLADLSKNYAGGKLLQSTAPCQ